MLINLVNIQYGKSSSKYLKPSFPNIEKWSTCDPFMGYGNDAMKYSICSYRSRSSGLMASIAFRAAGARQTYLTPRDAARGVGG
jgi:hypothetical protein